MELRDVQAALAELERQQKKLGNRIAHREKLVADAQADIRRMRRELEDLVDRHIALGSEERKIIEGESE